MQDVHCRLTTEEEHSSSKKRKSKAATIGVKLKFNAGWRVEWPRAECRLRV